MYHSSVTHDGWLLEFERNRGLYSVYLNKLQRLISDLIDRVEIKPHAIDGRVKESDSLRKRIYREGKSYSSLEQITDKIGCRVIVNYQSEVDAIISKLRKEFIIDEENSTDKREIYNTDRFGYVSVHLIVKLSKNRTALDEWRPYEGIWVEIQIRTVLQHAWANISHALQYKSENDVPSSDRRKLLRLSGLLEIADEEFRELYDRRNANINETASQIEHKNLDVEVNTISIEAYIDDNQILLELTKSAERAGFISGWPEDDPNQDADNAATDLAEVCKFLDIDKLQELHDVLAKLSPQYQVFFETFFKVKETTGGSWGSRTHYATMILLGYYSTMTWSQRELSEIWRRLRWGNKYFDACVEAGRQVFNQSA